MKATGKKHAYRIKGSILYDQADDYSLSESEYYRLYSFYVTYSCCGTQSMKKRTIEDYGWNSFSRPIYSKEPSNKEIYLKDALSEIINLDDSTHYLFTDDSDDVTECFEQLDLPDGQLMDIQTERAVITKTSEPNKFLQLCYRIRDGFAHGKFILKQSDTGKKMVIIQDDNSRSVTARLVLKLSTLLGIIQTVDKNNLIAVY